MNQPLSHMRHLFTTSWQHRILIVFIAAALVISGCDGGGGANEEETGTVEGRVTAADGATPIPGATVGLVNPGSAGANAAKSETRALYTVLPLYATVNTDGPTTTTDADGNFTLEGVPVGEQTLVAKRGVFESTFTVNVASDQPTEAPTAALESTKKLGVVPGLFDSIEDILVDLGNEIDTLSVDDLSDVDLLSDYSFVFINCGSGYTYPDERITALREYMEAGGTVYASDLEADYAEKLFPDDIAFDNSTSEQLVEATIVSDDLKQFVGKSTVELQYDYPSWERIVDISNAADVLLEGQPAELESGTEPLAVKFAVGNGRLIYTTFHNEAGVTDDQEVVLRYFIYLPSS